MTEIQKYELEMYKWISSVFIKHDIKFWAVGGTAIGALRENGFIPWDDDIDLAIKEFDRKRALKILKVECKNSTYSLKNSRNVYLPYNFFKIYDNRYAAEDENGLISSLAIDIFILHKERILTKSFKSKYTFWRVLANAKQSYKLIWRQQGDNFGIKFGYTMFKTLIFFVPRSFVNNHMVSSISSCKINTESNKYWIYDIKWNESYTSLESIELPFEDTVMPVPKNFVEDSKEIFGDIMKPPSKDMIWSHGLKIVERK